MSIVVWCEVTPPDPERLITAAKKFSGAFVQEGRRHQRVCRLESDPSRFCFLEEWASREAMENATDKLGPAFDRESGTEDAQWQTSVWTQVEL